MKKIKKDTGEELKGILLRTQADFDNYKKRIESEKKLWSDEAKISLLEELIEVFDNFYLISKHVPDDLKSNSWVHGISITLKQMDDRLSELGLKRISPLPGDKFDLNLHQAISSEPSSIDKNNIVKVSKPGYIFGEKLIRPASVITSSGDEK